jgi:two-component system, OmpR family, sensor histidine kinase BaeS
MRSLALKLTLAFLLVSLIATGLLALFATRTTSRQFNQFVIDQDQQQMLNFLASYYQATGSWAGIQDVVFAREMIVPGSGPMSPGGRQHGGTYMSGMANPGIVLIDNDGVVVLAGLGLEAGQLVNSEQWQQAAPIQINGHEAGRVIIAQDSFRRRLIEGAETLFVARVNRAILFSALGATAVALLLGVLLASSLTRPLRELTAATRAVARGDLDHQVPVRSKDELGELATSFNVMSTDLARARDLRRQMTADIAHDLRTPLSIILGHTEALDEGVLPPDPETFYIIHDEAQRLSRLVDDLRTLSLADAGELSLLRRDVAPAALLERAAAAHQPQARKKEIALELELAPDLPDVAVDPDRIAQVLDNLLANALRFTPAGGTIRLAAEVEGDWVKLIVQDNGPGIPVEDLGIVFDRFYRGDKARSRQEGGSGLGLAIARSLVVAHGGRIKAHSDPSPGPNRGVRFTIFLAATPKTTG